MADTAISGLTDGGTVQTTDQLAVNRSGSNFRVVVGALAPLATVGTAQIDAQAVTFTEMQSVSQNTIAGRITAGSGPLQELSATQVRTILNVADGATDDTTVNDHIADATDAHDASAISNVAAGNIVATDVQAAINELDTEKSAVTRTINAQTGTAFTPALTDAGNVITMDNAAANVLTVPTNAAVAYVTGTQLDVSQLGAGVTTITGDTGVTINGVSAGSGALSAQFGSVTLLKLATNTWLLTGNHDAVA